TTQRRDAVVGKAGKLRRGVEGQHFRRDRTETRCRDYVTGKDVAGCRSIGYDRRGRIINRARPLAEISLQHPGGWQRVQARSLSAPDEELVKGNEPERPVPSVIQLGQDSRSAECESEFILRPMRLRSGEKAAGIELVVIVEFPSASMQLVRAALHVVTG